MGHFEPDGIGTSAEHIYVLDNARMHAAQRGETYAPDYVDPYSSAGAPGLALPPAQTWLLRAGWKRGGP